MEKRRLRLLVFALLLIAILGNFVPTGYVIIGPGLALELDEIISVEQVVQEERGVQEEQGDILLTSISSRELNPWQLIFYLLFKPDQYELVSRDLMIPQGMDIEEYIKIQEDMMLASKQNARYIALKLAGFQPEVSGGGAKIEEVFSDSPARNILLAGDVITGLDGMKVHSREQLVEILRQKQVGDEVTVEVKRGKERKTFQVKTTSLPGNPDTPALGVIISAVQPEYSFPVEVEIKTDQIIGPSAGGMFTLEILNQLTEEDITNGKRIAGTGTISLTGHLGEIGGVRQKVITAEQHGASVFFCPEENYEQAVQGADRIDVISAETVFDILEYLGHGQLNRNFAR
ncbi:MAG: PDZ domain-containing protein [Halanaerobium sp.]|nr:PDZ domain-containing protein [Halanaerobium sp.]